MKYNLYINSLVIALALSLSLGSFAPVGAATSGCLILVSNVGLGYRDSSTGGQVRALQQYLFDSGYLQIAPTGYFGLTTRTAVKAFQTANGISSTGFAGPLTRSKIQSLSCASTDTASSGSYTASTTSALTPIYSEAVSNRHFYTSNFAEAVSMANTYGYSGRTVIGYLSSMQATSTLPLFRFDEAKTGSVILTTNIYIVDANYVKKAQLGYIYTVQAANTVPLHRLDNSRNGDHLFTTQYSATSPQTKTLLSQGWKYIGIIGYVYASTYNPAATTTSTSTSSTLSTTTASTTI